jgi:hypothetical protein
VRDHFDDNTPSDNSREEAPPASEFLSRPSLSSLALSKWQAHGLRGRHLRTSAYASR